MLLVVVAVVGLVAASDVAARITDAIDIAICEVSNGDHADCDSSGDRSVDRDDVQRAGPDSDADGLSDREERRLGDASRQG